MWIIIKKYTNKQNKNRLIDTENALTAVRRDKVGGLGEKGKGIKQKKWWGEINSNERK